MNIQHRFLALFFLLSPAIATAQDSALLDNPIDPELLITINDCESCHGKNGVSTDPTTPTIAGYSAFYMENALILLQARGRPCPPVTYPRGPKAGKQTTMCKAVATLDDYSLSELSRYFSEKTFKPAIQTFDPSQVTKGKSLHEKHCQDCHDDGATAGTDSGFLAGQWTPVLRAQLNAFAAGKRPMDADMKIKTNGLKAEEVTALLHFYASFQ
ncbi:c-type cytochrome [Teredinibacter franksiae]|uniref:c-type cytochrome n=1 Tax=Teredinibacter franksiae TaxID=2761453 RepID=UPI001623622C|nr:c-type cytochrome [Teredinibacter franksiae]